MFREILRFSRESKGGRIQKVKNMFLTLIKKKGGGGGGSTLIMY